MLRLWYLYLTFHFVSVLERVVQVSCLLEHEYVCVHHETRNGVQHNGLMLDYNSKMKKNRPLKRDLNQHPSVGQSPANRKTPTLHFHTYTHTHTRTFNLAIFTATKITPQGPTSSNQLPSAWINLSYISPVYHTHTCAF